MVSKGKIRLKGGGVEIAACLGGEREGNFLTSEYFNKQFIIYGFFSCILQADEAV